MMTMMKSLPPIPPMSLSKERNKQRVAAGTLLAARGLLPDALLIPFGHSTYCFLVYVISITFTSLPCPCPPYISKV